MNKQHAVILIAALALLGGGFLHGFASERWRTTQELEAALERVDLVPLDIGDWQGINLGGNGVSAAPGLAGVAAFHRAALNMKDDPESFAQAGAQSHWIRSYTHQRTGQAFLVILMCGRAGRMSVHTPEVCYRGAGYEVAADPSRQEIRSPQDDPLGAFWTARFLKQQGVTTDLRLFWAWAGTNQSWQAPDNPRWTFRGQPYLYKLYVSHDIPERVGSAPDQPALEFLQQFLPTLNATLQPPPHGAS